MPVTITWLTASSSEVLGLWGQAEVERLAGPEALARAARFRREADALDLVAARALARKAGAAVAGLPVNRVALLQRCADPLCRREEVHGAPSFAAEAGERMSVSWAHSKGLLACAVALRDAGGPPPRLGIDAEWTTPQGPPLVQTWAQWVRAEALVKAGLGGLDDALAAVRAHGRLGRDGRPDVTLREATLGASFLWDSTVVRGTGEAAVALALGAPVVAGGAGSAAETSAETGAETRAIAGSEPGGVVLDRRGLSALG